jgi:hypothetical protein
MASVRRVESFVEWVTATHMRPQQLTLTLLLVLLAFTVRAQDRTLLIELPSGVLPADVAANGTAVGSFRDGGALSVQPFHARPTSTLPSPLLS